MRKSFVMYAEWADQIINMTPELAGEYIQAILSYAIYGEDVKSDNQLINAMLVPVLKRIDEDYKKYIEKVERMNTCRNQKEIYKKSTSNLQEIKSVNVNVNVNDNDKKNKRSTFHNFPERKIDYEGLKNV